MSEITKEEEEYLKAEFERKVEMKKQWLLEECTSGGRYIDVSAKKLDDLDALTIALYLHECKQELKLFHIGANQFTDRGLIDMLTGLQWHDHLQEIYIGNNNFSDIGVEALIEVLPIFTCLRILSVGNCGVTDENFIQLCYQLPELKSLEQLIVPSNYIGDYGLICLSSLITTDSISSLRVLHFGDNLLTTYSLKSFFIALQKNRTIKTIYMNDMGLEIPTIRSIAECLKKNKSLQELNLGNTGFSDQAAGYIWDSLKHSQLKVLHLWNNHLTDVSILKLVQIMEQNAIPLNYLGLSDNPIENQEVIKDLSEILKQNQMVEDLPVRLKQLQDQIQVKHNEQQTEEKQKKKLAEEAELEELEEDLEQLVQKERDLKAQEKEQEENDEEEEETVVNELQGKLKEMKWVGEESDRRGYQHSKLEEIQK